MNSPTRPISRPAVVAALAACAVVLFQGAPRAAAIESGELAAITVMTELRMEAANAQLANLNTKYREVLAKRREVAQKAGKADVVKEFDAEIELIPDGLDAAPTPRNMDIAGMRRIYVTEKGRITPEIDKRSLAAEEFCVREINALVTSLNKAGKTAEADQAKDRLAAFQQEREEARQRAAEIKAGLATPQATDRPKGKFEKILMDHRWQWCVGKDKVPAFRIRFLEDGKIEGPPWMSGWEVVGDGRLRVYFNKTADRYWQFKLPRHQNLCAEGGSGRSPRL